MYVVFAKYLSYTRQTIEVNDKGKNRQIKE
jgi:hypothetical protein